VGVGIVILPAAPGGGAQATVKEMVVDIGAGQALPHAATFTVTGNIAKPPTKASGNTGGVALVREVLLPQTWGAGTPPQPSTRPEVERTAAASEPPMRASERTRATGRRPERRREAASADPSDEVNESMAALLRRDGWGVGGPNNGPPHHPRRPFGGASLTPKRSRQWIPPVF
jgi:hypothetical protein